MQIMGRKINRELLTSWWGTPAPWWKFWMPQSDYIGGCAMGLVIGLLINLLF